MSIKPPSGIQPPVPPITEVPAKPVTPGVTPSATPIETPATPTTMPLNPEAVAKALKDYQKLRNKLKHPTLSGAAGLFTDNVVFPNELLDPNNPANDPRYLHLLLAMFGLKEMKQFFATDEQREEDEEMEKEDNDNAIRKKPGSGNPKGGASKGS